MTYKWFRLITALTLIALSLSLVVLPASAQTTYITYVVQSGDTLGKIANQYCTTWEEIYDVNREVIGSDPSLIYPGMVLTVPANCNSGSSSSGTPTPGGVYDRGPMTHATGTYSAPYYTVAWGDTLSAIGQRFGIPWQDIAEANGIEGTTIYAGQALLIPDGSSSGSVPPDQGIPERVYFQTGAISATRSGVIYEGAPKSYILGASKGQTMTVNTYSHGEPLVISISNTAGDSLTLSGVNSQVNNSVVASLPANGDYIITVRPKTAPESPQLVFDITFIIP